jgi:16S rRNA (uracil1498-N3)-methyltransferase
MAAAVGCQCRLPKIQVVRSTMHRFHLPPEKCSGPVLNLDGREAHHAVRVLRVRKGDPVNVLDGRGREFVCEVLDSSRDSVSLGVKDTRIAAASACSVTLVQAIPKARLLDSIIQKATELGASRIIPLLAERVVSQIDDDKSESKTKHWQTTAIEAIKQCGALWLPQIEPPVTPEALLARGESFDLFLIASLQPGSRHARAWFDGFRKAHGREPQSVCVWVGPEGDFTAAEIAAALAAGACPITLGRLVLRCETAATYCLSIIQHEVTSSGT